MKRIIILLLSTFLLTANALAHKNVQRAFDKFIKSKKVQVEKSESSQFDPFPSGKTGEHLLLAQRDIYSFTLNVADRKLLDKILLQMENGRKTPSCYAVKTHRGGKVTPLERWMCLVGDGKENKNVIIGRNPLDNWMLSCYTADNVQGYRHLYAVEWQEPADGKQEIHGRLVYTYAIRSSERKVVGWKWTDDNTTEEEFLLHFYLIKENFEKYLSLLPEPPQAVLYIRSAAIYELCRDVGHVVKDTNHRQKIENDLYDLISKTAGKSENATDFFKLALQEILK